MFTRRDLLVGGASVAGVVFAGNARAEKPMIGLCLVLAIDSSGSINDARWTTQCQGSAQAFLDPDIQEALLSEAAGGVAIAVVQWSGPADQRVIVPWTYVASRGEIDVLAGTIARMPRYYAGGTYIGDAIRYSAKVLHNAPFRARRLVIDLSGDGVDSGTPLLRICRDQVVRSGITINGLALFGGDFSHPVYERIDDYFQAELIGGPECFVQAIENPDRLDQYKEGFKKKLLREIFMS